MLKKETVAGFVRRAKEAMEMYNSMPIEDVEMSIMNGNVKIGKCLCISILPFLTCGKAVAFCGLLCYAVKIACFRKSSLLAWARNSVYALYHRDLYFENIRRKLDGRKKNKYFRWHVAGEIIDAEYFEEMVKIAKEYPDFIFWTYTKRYSIVNDYVRNHGNCRSKAIPSNFKLRFSEWDGMPMDNPFKFPVFVVRLKKGNKFRTKKEMDRMFQCPSNCTWCREHKKGCFSNCNVCAKEH